MRCSTRDQPSTNGLSSGSKPSLRKVLWVLKLTFSLLGRVKRAATPSPFGVATLLVRHSEQFVMVIDGGTQESGGALVEHIKDCYGTNEVDLVVSSHP